MDSGLGVVEWPLSPYATALAAGALFAFCLTFWKYRFIKSRGTADKDPSGRKLIADLDPDEEKKARDRAGKEKREKEAAKARNFPVLAVGETQRRFNHEHLGLLGQFGAIPRTSRERFSESSNALSVLRRRTGEKGRRQNWQEFNPASINFSSIYQHPFCFGSEFGLNPGFFFNAKHNLHTYFSPFRDPATPGSSKEDDSFDVSIRPEILKNKPITRSALRLALQDQLHKFLNEPYREVRLNDRAIQTADISEDVEPPCDPSSFQSNLSESKREAGGEPQITKSGKVPLSALSLWDSGYGEKVFDEISDVSKEEGTSENLNSDVNCGSVTNAEPDIASDIVLTSDDLYLRKNSDSSKESSGETVIIIVSEKQDASDRDIELSDSTNIESDADFGTKIDEHSNENIDESVLGVVVTENETQEASDRVAELSDSTNIESYADFGTIVSECSNENIDESALDVIIIEDETYDQYLELSDSTNIESDADFGTNLGEYEYSSEINIYESILEEGEIAFDQNVTIYVDDFSDKNPNLSDISDPHPDFETKINDYENNGERNNHENILEDISDVVFDQNVNQYVGDFSNKNSDFSDISDPRVDSETKISETEFSSEINIHENILEDEEIFFLEDQNLIQCVGDFSNKNPDFFDISNPHADYTRKISECEHSGEINIHENIIEEEEIVSDRNLNPYDGDFPDKNPDFSVVSDPHLDSGRESLLSNLTAETENSESLRPPSEEPTSPDLDPIQGAFPTPTDGEGGDDENVFIREIEKNMSVKKTETRAEDRSISEERSSGVGGLTTPDLERVQSDRAAKEEEKSGEAGLSLSCEADLSEKRRRNNSGAAAGEIIGDVTGGGSSRDSPAFDEERGTFNLPRQMDRETGERSVAVESTVTTETTLRSNGDLARLSVVSRLALEDGGGGWSSEHHQDSVSVKTQFVEDFSPPKSNSSDKIVVERTNGNATTTNGKKEFAIDDPPSSPRVDRLKGLLCRDEERRARAKFHTHQGGAAMEGEWDRLLRDVLASVSELERWEQRRRCDDVSSDAEDAEEQQQHPSSSLQSDRRSSFAMEEEALVSPSSKGETPTKVKSLRFKLDPDIFDVPSDDSFYDDDDDDESRRSSWRKQTKYRAFSSSLELDDEPVRLVSVHASVVPAGQKMVARPVGIDLRVRLTEERQTISKRAHVSTSPSQAKRRSPVSDRGWCQELSPVTENVDWRETFTPVATPENNKTVPNGILKTPSPKTDPSPIESPNPFKIENGVTPVNGVSPVNGNDKPPEKPRVNGWKPPVEKKPFLLLPRKKFEPDPEAIERITGYRSALSKPPLPPPIPSKTNANIILKSRAEQARKQYLDNKNALASNKGDGMKKFQQFLNQAQNDRARIVTSVPDLAAIERAVTEQWTKERASVSPRESPVREDVKKTEVVMPSSCSTTTTPDDKWASYVQSCRKHLGRRSQSMSYLETDIDVIPILDDDDKCQSVTTLDEPDEALPDPDDSDLDRSREDLDDSGRAKSEHELRIERSLRSLPVPDWYRRSEKTKSGFLLGSSSNKEKRGWAAAKSLASSTSSLASCGLRRPVRSLRSSRENIPWSRSSASPDGPTLSLALAKAFREPYLGWRARTPTSSGVSSSPRASPPSWGATTTDDEANGVSFDGEDAFGRTTSSEEDRRDEPLSLDDTGADAVTVSMDTNDPVKLPGGEDTCDDINNMSMDTCELFDASVVVPVDEDPSPQADTGDDIDNLSTDTTTTEGRKLDPKLKRYSYSQSIYHSEWDEEEESRGDRKGKEEEDREPSPSSPDHKVVWIESSFVGSRTTTSIVVLPEKKAPGSAQNRPASR